MIVIALVLKFTTLGLYTQSVGINPNSSRLNGINPAFVKFITLCDPGSVRGGGRLYQGQPLLHHQLLGGGQGHRDGRHSGNALSGGKFNMAASILGAYVIQFLTTTLYSFNVDSSALPAYKAVVVIILVVLSAPTFQEKLTKLKRKPKLAAAAKEGN